MSLDRETIIHLRSIKEQIEELLEEVGDIVPPEFRTTCILRYAGSNPDVRDMVWTDDVHDDAISALEKQRDMLEE